MVRRYEEPIEVRTPSEPFAPSVGRPEAFVWRGRFYLVREVIDHWQERRAWWHDVLDSPGTAPDGPSSTLGARDDDRERRVWRVAASPGRQAGTGVYDLGADGDPARWVLLRAQD